MTILEHYQVAYNDGYHSGYEFGKELAWLGSLCQPDSCKALKHLLNAEAVQVGNEVHLQGGAVRFVLPPTETTYIFEHRCTLLINGQAFSVDSWLDTDRLCLIADSWLNTIQPPQPKHIEREDVEAVIIDALNEATTKQSTRAFCLAHGLREATVSKLKHKGIFAQGNGFLDVIYSLGYKITK